MISGRGTSSIHFPGLEKNQLSHLRADLPHSWVFPEHWCRRNRNPSNFPQQIAFHQQRAIPPAKGVPPAKRVPPAKGRATSKGPCRQQRAVPPAKGRAASKTTSHQQTHLSPAKRLPTSKRVPETPLATLLPFGRFFGTRWPSQKRRRGVCWSKLRLLRPIATLSKSAVIIS